MIVDHKVDHSRESDNVPAKTMRLLVVEDHPMLRDSLRAFFAAGGAEVVTVANGEEALQAAARESFSLVLLDVNLPDGSGLNVLHGLKDLSPNLPVVMHSYDDAPHRLAASFRRGAAGYVRKGTRVEEMYELIEQAVLGESLWTQEQRERIRSLGEGTANSSTPGHTGAGHTNLF